MLKLVRDDMRQLHTALAPVCLTSSVSAVLFAPSRVISVCADDSALRWLLNRLKTIEFFAPFKATDACRLFCRKTRLLNVLTPSASAVGKPVSRMKLLTSA